MKSTNLLFWGLLILIFPLYSSTAQIQYITAKPKKGEGISDILNRYLLEANNTNFKYFKELNKNKFDKKGRLLYNIQYKLPIAIIKFDGKSIRTSLGIKDIQIAKQIDEYNLKALKAGLQKQSYKKSKEIWIPLSIYNLREIKSQKPEPKTQESLQDTTSQTIKAEEKRKEEKSQEQNNVYPIFGSKYKNIDIISNDLEGCIFYLVSGHGGPDPGAIGVSEGNKMCEDEYAYDITLRLGRNLLQHGATVYFIVEDPDNGIRDEQYLVCDENEYFYEKIPISDNQLNRLRTCANIVNQLYEKNTDNAKMQIAINIHLDSRQTHQRIDIFFYHQEGCLQSEELTNTLHQTIRDKYNINQPGRGYQGTVTTRNLYMLRNVKPVSTYIELGNIKNPKNQVRFKEKNNRQAIANWLCQGILKYLANLSKEIH